MAFPRNSLRAFLGHARSKVSESLKSGSKVTCVIGNESADLDSLTSSLLYAYIRSTQPPSACFSPVYIPLVNIPSAALRLRPEFTAVCKHAGIDTQSLLCLDDDRREALRLGGNHVRWIPVDHNRLTGSLSEIQSSNLIGVVDHHEDESYVPHNTHPEPRIIEEAGSCTSLVVRHLKDSWTTISTSSISAGASHGQQDGANNDSAFTSTWDAQAAKMALASILIDTGNLTAPGKVRPVDREAVEYLETKIWLSKTEGPSWDRKRFYDEISDAKADLKQLSLEEILGKDYKQWSENGIKLGMSSTVKDLEYLIAKAEQNSSPFERVAEDFLEAHGLDLHAVMTAYFTDHGEFQRQLLLRIKAGREELARRITEHAVAGLSLDDIEVSGIEARPSPKDGEASLLIWQQRDLSKSRKQVAPLLRRLMHQ